MNANKIFFDTNTLLYLLSTDNHKANWISKNLQQRNVISIQVLNEFMSASLRKIKLTSAELDEFLDLFTSTFNVRSFDIDTFETGLTVSRRYGYQHYDGNDHRSRFTSWLRKVVLRGYAASTNH